MRRLTDADYLRMPWKNGGGITTQLAVAPDGATLDSCDWRISTAQVNAAGPFSAFPGIDRSLSVLQGAGLVLHVEDGTPFMLTAENNPLPFAGEQRVHAELIDGPILDFNVMTRRGRYTHMLQAMRIEGTRQIERQADLVFIHCARGGTVHCRSAAGEEISLAAGDAVLMDSSDGKHIQLSAESAAHVTVTQLKFKETDHVR
jgi:environmental stress-induced protein Ves